MRRLTPAATDDRWAADLRLVDQLVAAERAFTATFRPQP
jgi:hypothetical protein